VKQHHPEHHARLRTAWSEEMNAARTGRDQGDARAEWTHLERAHILSQPLAGPHVRTHAAMFGAAVRKREPREIVGQAMRLVVAGEASLTERYPVGNTGGADVSAFKPMTIPDDLRALLEDKAPQGAP